jgi:hypothetical protein
MTTKQKERTNECGKNPWCNRGVAKAIRLIAPLIKLPQSGGRRKGQDSVHEVKKERNGTEAPLD